MIRQFPPRKARVAPYNTDKVQADVVVGNVRMRTKQVAPKKKFSVRKP